MNDSVWIFIAPRASFPSGVFSSLIEAETWINKYALTGILTEYVVGKGVYDWAVETKKFIPKVGKIIDSRFIGSFTTASMEHYHYERGERL